MAFRPWALMPLYTVSVYSLACFFLTFAYCIQPARCRCILFCNFTLLTPLLDPPKEPNLQLPNASYPGTEVEVKCIGDSRPLTSIELLKNGVQVVNETAANTSVYTIKGVACSDSGTYRCVVYNSEYNDGDASAIREEALQAHCKYPL